MGLVHVCIQTERLCCPRGGRRCRGRRRIIWKGLFLQSRTEVWLENYINHWIESISLVFMSRRVFRAAVCPTGELFWTDRWIPEQFWNHICCPLLCLHMSMSGFEVTVTFMCAVCQRRCSGFLTCHGQTQDCDFCVSITSVETVKTAFSVPKPVPVRWVWNKNWSTWVFAQRSKDLSLDLLSRLPSVVSNLGVKVDATLKQTFYLQCLARMKSFLCESKLEVVTDAFVLSSSS